MWDVLMDTQSVVCSQARKLCFRKPAPFSPPLGAGLRGPWPRGNRCPFGLSLGSLTADQPQTVYPVPPSQAPPLLQWFPHYLSL